MFGNFKQLKMFEENIRNIVRQEIAKLQCMKTLPATISSINGDGTVNVKIVGDNVNTLNNIKNKSGVTLVMNDNVYLYLPQGTLTGCFVGVKF